MIGLPTGGRPMSSRLLSPKPAKLLSVDEVIRTMWLVLPTELAAENENRPLRLSEAETKERMALSRDVAAETDFLAALINMVC